MAGGEGLSSEDHALLARLVEALEKSLHQRSQTRGFWERYATPVTVGLSAIGLGVTIWISQGQLNTSREQFDDNQQASALQFERTLRQNQYSDIVGGMASSSVAVQVNSIRRLVQYVVEPKNFETTVLQEQAALNAAQTLAAFIEDESAETGREGLTDYRDPQPVVVGRAVDQLFKLTGLAHDADDDMVSFPQLSVDLTRGNFHGVGVSDFAPSGSFLAIAADFRAATVTGWNLAAVEQPSLSSAFFTCANMQSSNFGTSNVAAADFTGANLRGADLSRVTGLTSEQIRGALVGPLTRLPADVERPPQPGWGITEDNGQYRPSLPCRHLLDQMTDLLAGSGYSSRLPCPGSSRSPWRVHLSTREHKALDRVCQLRKRLERTLTPTIKQPPSG